MAPIRGGGGGGGARGSNNYGGRVDIPAALWKSGSCILHPASPRRFSSHRVAPSASGFRLDIAACAIMTLSIALKRRAHRMLVVPILLGCLASLASASPGDSAGLADTQDASYDSDGQNVLIPVHPAPNSAQGKPLTAPTFSASATSNALQDLHSALETMQQEYFSLWLGKWTTAIDWTAAVMGTHMSAALSSLSHSISYTMPGTFDKGRKLDVEAQMVENEINKYFGQTIAYYFGEDAFGLRMQAYDDMLWVVLGWLDSIQFIESHSHLHYPLANPTSRHQSTWHGQQFTPAFAHRARVFYELASAGWDWKLCGGGMTWNPNLLPYKNAITNELFISASINMYLHFPGDKNCSPFMSAQDSGPHPPWKKLRAQESGDPSTCSTADGSLPEYDPIYLANAVNGYNWLKNSGMQNEQGLYVDGFHIRGYGRNGSIGTGKCDERNEMVYTYNQGVILSGLRGLWEATGKIDHLEDGHELVRNVIRATGWTDSDLAPFVSFSFSNPEHHGKPSASSHPHPNPESTSKEKAKHKNPPKPSPHQHLFARNRNPTPPPPLSPSSWSGLGTNGILTDACDPLGICSQDGQTFKGIFFHHLVHFCAPLPTVPVQPGKTFAASKEAAMLHRMSCREYTSWVVRNARMAMGTRDEGGRFGGWWGVGVGEGAGVGADKKKQGKTDKGSRKRRIDSETFVPEGAVDYRNDGGAYAAFFEAVEGGDEDDGLFLSSSCSSSSSSSSSSDDSDTPPTYQHMQRRNIHTSTDLNDRGRGRTVETQGGGVAVLRAMWEFLRRDDGEGEEG
ncbi:glycoside hydrolase family 76 protein [Amniculicola lignicola CBS 123094]|uniref:Glycoside hydrolase family 76 protein n=1 Tax=Amniculicola lignicola CBS 123094 TaxID=1392246 RepID=A0A6A5WKF0_9PLEO|nr:glycoside hydrolase family 76 protein [Amniculicola lignicola CBS 123094]